MSRRRDDTADVTGKESPPTSTSGSSGHRRAVSLLAVPEQAQKKPAASKSPSKSKPSAASNAKPKSLAEIIKNSPPPTKKSSATAAAAATATAAQTHAANAATTSAMSGPPTSKPPRPSHVTSVRAHRSIPSMRSVCFHARIGVGTKNLIGVGRVCVVVGRGRSWRDELIGCLYEALGMLVGVQAMMDSLQPGMASRFFIPTEPVASPNNSRRDNTKTAADAPPKSTTLNTSSTASPSSESKINSQRPGLMKSATSEQIVSLTDASLNSTLRSSAPALMALMDSTASINPSQTRHSPTSETCENRHANRERTDSPLSNENPKHSLVVVDNDVLEEPAKSSSTPTEDSAWGFRRYVTKFGTEGYSNTSRTDIPDDFTVPLSSSTVLSRQMLQKVKTNGANNKLVIDALWSYQTLYEVKTLSVTIIIPEFHIARKITYSATDTAQSLITSLLHNYETSGVKNFLAFLPLGYQQKLVGLWLDNSRTLESYSLSSLVEPTLILYNGTFDEKIIDTSTYTWLRNNLAMEKLISKWISALINWEAFYQPRKKKIKEKVRKGVPDCLRGYLWQKLSCSGERQTSHPQEYEMHLKSTEDNEFARKIKVDVGRTFPNHPFFATATGQETLYRVLYAYSVRDSDVGYCQGLNFVVGTLLMRMNEEAAFWTLDSILLLYSMRGFFLAGVPCLSSSLTAFEALVSRLIPDISEFFNDLNVPYGAFASWFLTIFAGSFPVPLVSMIWDWFFCEDFTVVFKVALSFLKMNREKLFKLSFSEIIPFLQSEPHKMSPQEYDVLLTQAAKVVLPPRLLADIGM
ncbi:ecotropic viral integration site 5 protein [Pelomyxa schiedti]|nr:ecotropic viral integration site 5 protein [Pelomyxa schiedti]